MSLSKIIGKNIIGKNASSVDCIITYEYAEYFVQNINKYGVKSSNSILLVVAA